MQDYKYSTAMPHRGGSRSGALTQGLVACLLMILAFHTAWSDFAEWWHLGARGVTTEAQARSPVTPTGWISWTALTGQTVFDAVYIDAEGKAAPLRVTVGRGGPEFRRGRFVDVVYDPQNPEAGARLAAEQAAGPPEAVWLAFAGGVVCLLLLFLSLLRFARLAREE